VHLDYKVVVVTPAGRKEYIELLAQYLLRDHGLVDEYHLWLNTLDNADLEYLYGLEQTYPGYIFCIKRDPDIYLDMNHPGFSIFQFFRYCTEQDTVYVRLDDDICYVSREALRELIDFRIRNREYFLVSANIINNALCSYLHQRMGLIDTRKGIAGYSCTDTTGWRDPRFAEHVHNTFFRHYGAGHLDKYKFERWELNMYERFSINCISWLGEDFQKFSGEVGVAEEEWLSRIKPMQLGRINCICGNSIVCHYAFYTQRAYLSETNILKAYKTIYRKEISSEA
jgi:hypothetical protein